MGRETDDGIVNAEPAGGFADGGQVDAEVDEADRQTEATLAATESAETGAHAPVDVAPTSGEDPFVESAEIQQGLDPDIAPERD